MDINTISNVTSVELFKVLSKAIASQSESVQKMWERFAETREINEALSIADAFYAGVKAEAAVSHDTLSGFIHAAAAA